MGWKMGVEDISIISIIYIISVALLFIRFKHHSNNPIDWELKPEVYILS
jgi:hypothetical protein